MARTDCLVCLISTVNGCSKENKPWKTSASSGLITKLKQSILLRCLWKKTRNGTDILSHVLHWQSLLAKPLAISHHENAHLSCLWHLGRFDTNRIISICVALPKVCQGKQRWPFCAMILAIAQNIV